MTPQFWQFVVFSVGLLLWMLNKADDRSKGIDPLVPRWWNYFGAYWIPLLSRYLIDVAFYWALFDQQIVSKGLEAAGRTNWAWGVMMVTQFKPMAFFFGFFLDALMEKLLASSWSDKIPLIKSIPAIPPPNKV